MSVVAVHIISLCTVTGAKYISWVIMYIGAGDIGDCK